MADIRLYLPLSAADAKELATQGRLLAGRPVFLVDDRLRAADPSGDEESWEYSALQEAARAAAQRGPVLVAAADVASTAVTMPGEHEEQEGPQGSWILTTPVTMPRIAAFHVGEDVLSGAEPLPGEPVELSWYDTTELAEVVSLVSTAINDD